MAELIYARGMAGNAPQPAQQSQEAGVVMDVVQIVHDHHEPLARIAGPQAAKRGADVDHALASAEEPAETISVDVIEAKELLRALEAPVGGAHPPGLAPRGPGDAPERLELQRAPLVEADYRRPRRGSCQVE
jgi:hypothetical protein